MASGVPNYELYGESERSPVPDILHCESIATRSHVHDGEIKSHRHDGLTQVFYIRSGSIQARLEDELFDLNGQFLILVPSLCIHGFDISKNTDGWVITLPDSGLREILQPAPQVFDALTRPRVIQAIEGLLPFGRIEDLFRHIAGEFAGTEIARQFVLRSAIGQLLALVFRVHSVDAPRTNSKGADKLARFRDRIEDRFRHHDNIGDYAREIGMSPAHLNRICRQLTGKSALEVVHDRVMVEAKRDLVYSTMTVGEIAAVTGFGDPAYFTRFFTRNAGLSPARYRQAALNELSTRQAIKPPAIRQMP